MGWYAFSVAEYVETVSRTFLLGTLVHHSGANLKSVEFAIGDAALAVHPDDPELLARLGWGAYNQGLAREAVEALEAALALDWARFADRARLGFALLAVGETERAHRELSHAIAAHPGAKWVPRAKEVLGMGSTGS